MQERHFVKEHHLVRSAAISAVTLVLAIAAVAGQVYGKGVPPSSDGQHAPPSTLASNPPPPNFWQQYLVENVARAPTPVPKPEVNNSLNEKPTLADLDQWTRIEGKNGEKIFTAQTKDGFWANIVVEPEREVWSVESYTGDLLTDLRKVDSGARYLNSDMTPEEFIIPEGGYLITARSKQSPESDGLDSLTYLLVVPTEQFGEEVAVYILTMQAPRNQKEMGNEDLAVETLRELVDSRVNTSAS